jgi:hypothetical protein
LRGTVDRADDVGDGDETPAQKLTRLLVKRHGDELGAEISGLDRL